MNFTPSQIEALEISAKHWRKNLEHARNRDFCKMDISGDSCECCHRFYNSPMNVLTSRCSQCPIFKYTCAHHCRKTPWAEVFRLIPNSTEEEKEVDMDKFIAAIEAECEFLEALARGETPP